MKLAAIDCCFPHQTGVTERSIGRDNRSAANDLLHDVVVSPLAGQRAGTRAAKNRSAVRGSGKKLYKQKKDLSYNAMTRRMQPLVSAAAYHFGSYRKAVERAGIDYAAVTRRPRWTRQMIIGLIKDARRSGDDLHWSAVTKRRDELGKAAFASLHLLRQLNSSFCTAIAPVV